jgi:hypothetical protein
MTTIERVAVYIPSDAEARERQASEPTNRMRWSMARPSGVMASMLPGSAIVGPFTIEVGRIMIDYEGNKYGAANLRRYVERVYHAWDRQTSQYPTLARAWVMGHELVRIADFDPRSKTVIVHPLDERRLCEWLGVDALTESELVF